MKETVYPIQIHFKGKSLEERAVPIFELGESLLAIQRLVQRAYLIASDNDEQRRINRVSTRENLALQIVRQEKGSDLYVLDWFIKTAATIPPGVIEKTLELLFTAGIAFVTEKVIGQRGLNRQASLLLDDFFVLSNRIGTVGKIEEIEIQIKNKKTSITITKRVKEYIARISKETVTREDTSFLGTVKTVYIDSQLIVDAQPLDFKHKVRVTVAEPEDFNNILETSAMNKKTVYKFDGYTQVRPGEDPKYFENFTANRVTLSKGKRKSKNSPRKKKTGKADRRTSKEPIIRSVKKKKQPK